MATDKDITEIVRYDNDTGLIVSTQSEIFQSLKDILYSSFGTDFVIQEGSEMFTFLDLLSTSLAQSAGAYKKVYDSIGFVNASGVTLDNAVALAGISRNGMSRSKVNITLSRDTNVGSVTLSFPRIRDINGNSWYTDETITIEEGETSKVATFYASDGNSEYPYNIFIKAKNSGTELSWDRLSGIPASITFIQNAGDSVLGEEKETDAHLRYRYYLALHTNSVATVDGLKSKLLNMNNLDLEDIGITNGLENPPNYVYIHQNVDSNKDGYDVPGHSIWVIVDGENQTDVAGITDNEKIARLIKNFKSLGAGTSFGKSDEGHRITCEIDGNTIYFSRAEDLDCAVEISISIGSSVLTEDYANIQQAIEDKILNYVNNLGVGNDVLFGGISSAIYELYSSLNYSDYVFDITGIKIGKAGTSLDDKNTRLFVDIYQSAKIISDNITINLYDVGGNPITINES